MTFLPWPDSFFKHTHRFESVIFQQRVEFQKVVMGPYRTIMEPAPSEDLIFRQRGFSRQRISAPDPFSNANGKQECPSEWFSRLLASELLLPSLTEAFMQPYHTPVWRQCLFSGNGINLPALKIRIFLSQCTLFQSPLRRLVVIHDLLMSKIQI